jgi:ketosteroid isomerase-like protein
MIIFFRLFLCLVAGSYSAMASDPISLKAELLQTEADFCALALTSGVEVAFAKYAAPEAVFFDVDPQKHRGAEAIRLRFEGRNPKAVLSWTPVSVEVSAAGDLGYTWGTYEYRAPGPDGQDHVGTGHYVSIWKRQPSGEWKFILDTGNPSPPVRK